jgi:Ner family transcriptional regulator
MSFGDMDPELIKYEIRVRGKSLADLAKTAGVSRQTMSIALHARASARAEVVIAEFLGLSPKQIWPSRYDDAGNRMSVVEARAVARRVAA